MPFRSKAQQGFMYAHPDVLGKAGLKEWSAKTDFKHLPKKLKSYESGGTVTETGPAILHAGEKVIPVADEPSSLKELMAEHLGSGKKKKKAKLHMSIHKMDDKKFMVQHEYRGGDEPTPSEEHAPANLAALHKHIDDNYGDEDDMPEPAGPATPQSA